MVSSCNCKKNGLLELFVKALPLLLLMGCGKTSDQEIEHLIENVIGVDIPDKFDVVKRGHSSWYSIDESREYKIYYEKKEFEELISRIDKSKWRESINWIYFESPSHPYESVGISSPERFVQYRYVFL